MRGFLLVLSLFVLVTGEGAAMKNRAEPFPTDQCGATVVTNEDERLYIFSLSEDSVVWYKFQKPEGGWSNWKPVADKRKMSSGPSPVRHVNGTIQVFARGSDLQFYTSILSGNDWSTWATFTSPQTFFSQPVPVITASGSCLVFGIDATTHSVWFSRSSPITSDVYAFANFNDLGGEATSAPSVLIDSESLLHVFIRGTNRGVWHLAEVYPQSVFVTNATSKTWGQWECIGGVMASSPRVPVTLNGVNLPEVYGRAADKALWSRRLVAQQNGLGATWDTWASLGGVLASGVSVALTDEGLIQVFARATDKGLYFKSQVEDANGDISFTSWQTLGGLFSATPSVIVRSDGTIDIFARGIDKAIWHSHQVEVNGTRSYTSWHTLGGHTRKFTC